jgi:L-alanine-DL-glutamate epimerase-like enolase superfamily enzyme
VRITDVETIILRLPSIEMIADGTQDALLVRVHTDEGIVGTGEVDASPEVIRAIIEAPASHALSSGLRELVVGEDPMQARQIWDKMYRGSIFFGRRGPAVMAMSGIDIALWDIIGQVTGRPVHAALGGAYRTRIRAYASTLMPETPQAAAAEATRWAEAGFRAIKFGWGGFATACDGGVELVRAIRKAVGDEVDILLDIGFNWEPSSAIAYARRLEEFRPFWIEEPFWPDDKESYARLADAIDTRVAGGEEETTRWAFRELIDEGHVDVVQPDVSRAGGFTEVQRIAELAAMRGRPCVPHAWSTGILKAATLHMNAAIPNALFMEFCVWEGPLGDELTEPRFWIDGNGDVQIPQTPGLGVALREEVIARYRM